ncbi:MAG: HK97 family phage prohead protease [Hyphomicrobium sp.]
MTACYPTSSAPELKTSALGLSVAAGDGAFEGYASLFEREDMAHDVVARGAFARSLAERRASGIRMLFQHDANQPIGVWEELREDARGLYARGRLALDVEKAREVLALMRAGAIDGLSIGFKAVKVRRDATSGVRRLESVDLWEISVVTFPMLPGARVAHVKARPFGEGVPTERQFERWLTRDAGLARSEARAVMRSGLHGLKALRDAGRGEDGEATGVVQKLRAASRLLRTNI